jgi:hypothetical protein
MTPLRFGASSRCRQAIRLHAGKTAASRRRSVFLGVPVVGAPQFLVPVASMRGPPQQKLRKLADPSEQRLWRARLALLDSIFYEPAEI